MPRLLDQLGASPPMAEIRRRVERLLARVGTRSHVPSILVEGEPGVGKSLLARAIHDAGPRRHIPFQSLNCGQLPETLAESELLGHLRGAFTDARTARAGIFERSHGGVLLLDDVGTLPLATQPKLLQVIQDREVRRLGGGDPLRVDVWIIAATNEPLDLAVAQGRFRRDLRDRLAQITFEIPPLRSRPEDILPLARHFLGEACAEFGLTPKVLTPAACDVLATYPWPGNVRELENAMIQLTLQLEGDRVAAEPLRAMLNGHAPRSGPRRRSRDGGVDRERLRAALELHGGNEYRVSKELDIPRSTVRYHIEKHGLRGPSRRPGRPLAPAAPPGPAARDGHMRWETRPVAALRLTLPAMPGALAAPSQPLIGIATERIEALEGQVVDVSPHGLLAIFGVSKIEDAAYRAARAGLGLLRTIERDHRPLVAGLAVHCRVSLVGRAGDRGVVSAEDLAQIRCDLAAALPFLQEGALIATDEAAAYLRRRFTLVPHRGGPAAPALAHVVIGPLRVGSEAASPAPRHLAGRNAELAQLEDLLARARSGRGQAVWVTGEAGIGKSRLLVEFLRRLDRSVADTFEGRCQPDLRTPYLAAGDIVRDVFGIAEMDGLAAAEEKVRRGLAELALDPGALAPPLLDLLGLVPLGGGARSSPEALKARASAAVRQTLLAGASRRPLVLILEDMQWADEPSADVITALVDAMGAARILLVATYRTGFAPPWVTRSLASQLKLSPLGEAASIQLVRGMAGGDRIADDVLAGVLARAEGIPLFLEEFTRAAAIDPGLLEHSVPGAIREVLTSRVDRLGATDRAIVQAASVLAADFSLEALAALLPEIDGAEVEQGLTRLEAAELVREQRAAPVPMYSFHHVLTREAVYLGLAPEVRRRLHVAMLDTMGRWPADAPERAPEVMARHLAGSDRTEEAVDAWLRAGRQARGRSANVDAISHLQKGLGLLRALPVGMEREARELQLQVAMAHALVATKGYAAVEVEVALARANELGQALGSLPQLLEVLLGGWQLRLLRSEHDDAARLAEQLLTMSEKSGQPIARALALLSQALPDYYRGHVPDATAALAGAAAITVDCADQLAALDLDQHPGVVAHGFLAVALLVGGRLDDAVEPAKRALALARGSRHALSLAAGLHLSCLINQQRGDADLVAALAAEELAVAREHVLPFWIAGGLFFSGWAMARQGKLAEAIPRMREGIDLHRGSGALLGLPAYLADLAAAHIAAGDLDQATDALDQGLRQVHTHGETSYAAELHRIRGDLLLRLGAEPEGAEGQYREGHEIACRQAQALYALRSALGLARMWHRDGRSGAARELLLSSIAPFAAQAASAPELLQARTALIDLATSVPPAR